MKKLAKSNNNSKRQITDFRIFSDDDDDPDDECNAFQFGSEEDQAAKKADARGAHQPDNDGDGQSSGLRSGDMSEVRQ